MYFVGIDISKNSFHYYVSNSDRIKIVSGKLKQNMSGFTTFDKILKKSSEKVKLFVILKTIILIPS
ncbi:hypothetical protein X928_08290 [Petrotoga miotherma DSM 10691]|uniref:Uncharacterized protein n=1 Tax=Petrotoga miotherma DSM 10691 TaxID=1434326 RepID=A0A2K1P861_9BACT|nr:MULTISPECIES: hypothetical protein [Petrotoga]PNR98985.1 hypothetical protein X928_08290 [Petrotoga miotherma DSM 10691]